MPAFESPHEEVAHHYAVALAACREIAQMYYYRGRLAEAQHVLRTTLQLIEPVAASEAEPQDRLKLLLLYGQVLTTDHFLNATDADHLFAPILQAKQVADAVQDQAGMADALSLLGQAHYFATLIARVSSGLSPNSPQGEGHYDDAFAYQQQALERREALHDIRGISESLFYCGIVYERWQQRDRAIDHYKRALQLAQDGGHRFEMSEPTRHLAWDAVVKGDLDRALAYAVQALTLREAANFRPHLPFDHLLLSDIYQARGETASALRHAELAAALAAEMGSTRTIAMASEHLEQLSKR